MQVQLDKHMRQVEDQLKEAAAVTDAAIAALNEHVETLGDLGPCFC